MVKSAWIDLLETLVATKEIEREFYTNTSPNVAAASATTLNVIVKEPAFEYIVRRCQLWCSDNDITFLVDCEGYGPDTTFSSENAVFDVGFALRPIENRLDIVATNGGVVQRQIEVNVEYYKIRKETWAAIKEKYIHTLIKKVVKK